MRKQKGSWSLGSSGADRTPQVITKVFPDTAATHPLAHPRPWALLCGSQRGRLGFQPFSEFHFGFLDPRLQILPTWLVSNFLVRPASP